MNNSNSAVYLNKHLDERNNILIKEVGFSFF